ncbi:DUF2993 domain-containing protein [Streptomyces sp. NPDC020965]|uniref:DUF2993 domain-containing protein n=1 Tax=Streptomyces sp. NPDC020965 TaxID=3365105 RepID=UPI0037BDB19D
MRALRILLILTVVIGGLFIAADRIAVNLAESEVADRVRSSQGLSSTPEVSINGFPFLTQVVDKRLEDVDVSLGGLSATAGGRTVNVTEVKAELRDVKVNSSYSSAVAGRADGSARISYADLTKAAPEGARVTFAGAERAAKNQVKIEGVLADVLKGAGISLPRAAEALLGDRSVSTYSTVELRGGDTIRLKADALPSIPVPGLGDKLRDAVDYELKIEKMPSSLKLDRLETTRGGLEFAGTGRGVALVG